MKKIKIIDLLNKIANGEYPTIKDGINKYEYDKDENDYITGMGYNYEYYFSNINILNYLNDEVEIIEEEKKIPEKLPNDFHYTGEEENIAKKINEIIDYLKSKGE